jgi:hypothetical protein
MSVTSADILAELDNQPPRIRDIFLKIIRDIVGVARAAQIESLLARGRAAEIPNVLKLQPSALSPLIEAIRQAVNAGGDMTAKGLRRPGVGAVINFDMRNVAVEEWIRRHAAQLVTAILEDQRAAIRATVAAGVEAGRGPWKIALDIVGRLDPVTNTRIGGIVGLTAPQAQYVANMRAELEALSADYFDRARRDKRFDSVVSKAIGSDEPLGAANIDRIVSRYADRLLLQRGEMIARTEALEAFNAGRDLAVQQAINEGEVSAQNVTKIWDSAHDTRVRSTHRALSGSKVPMNGVFVSPSGARMRHPGDTSLGAPADEIIQCRCIARYKIDWLAQGLGGGA